MTPDPGRGDAVEHSDGDDRKDQSDGAGPRAGSIPLGLRSRARRLYRARRERLLQIPVAELKKRWGDSVDLDETHFTNARVELADASIEVGFAGTYKMFGALIDTQWVGSTGDVGADRIELSYRFDKNAFVTKRGTGDALAGRLSDATTRKLADRSQLKAMDVIDDGSSRTVTITPLPGTITAMYFPPLPPYTVPMKPSEAADQLDLLLHILRI